MCVAIVKFCRVDAENRVDRYDMAIELVGVAALSGAMPQMAGQ